MHALAKRLPEQEGDGNMVTLAQKWKNEDREEGREKGLQEAALKIAKSMLSNGLDRQSVMKMTDLTEVQLQQLNP